MNRIGHVPSWKTPEVMAQTRDHIVYVLSQKERSLFELPTQGSRQYYTGVTTNVKRRLMQHNSGKTKSTKGIEWVLLAMLDGFTRSEAYQIERYLKRGDTRAKRAEFYGYALSPFRDYSTAQAYFEMVAKKCRHFKWFGTEVE